MSAPVRLFERRIGRDAARVTRFLRGRMQFRGRSDDLFISSYPRSGTTWMQHIAHALRSGGDVSFQHISHVVPWFERSLALGRCNASDFERLPSPRVFKSHLPRTWLPSGARYLYVERDGRDVAVSYYHLYRSHLGFSGTFDQFYESFLRGDVQYRSWFKHVAGWRAYASDPALLIVQYETLRAGLGGELDRIARFWPLPLAADLRKKLQQLCAFEFMKMHESQFDHALAEPAGGRMSLGGFIRRGESGSFAEHLSPEQQARFFERLREATPRAVLELDLPAFLH